MHQSHMVLHLGPRSTLDQSVVQVQENLHLSLSQEGHHNCHTFDERPRGRQEAKWEDRELTVGVVDHK